MCVCDLNAPRFPVTTFVCLNGPLKSRVEVNSLLAGEAPPDPRHQLGSKLIKKLETGSEDRLVF